MKKYRKGNVELQVGEPQVCDWEEQGMNPPGRYFKENEEWTSDPKQSAWLHSGQIMPDQSGGLLWQTENTSVAQGSPTDVVIFLDFCKASDMLPQHNLISNWREMDLKGWLISRWGPSWMGAARIVVGCLMFQYEGQWWVVSPSGICLGWPAS